MKKITLFLALMLAVVTGSYGQVASYAFSQGAGTYTPITGGTTIASCTSGVSGVATMDDVIYNLPAATIPFSFVYDGVGYDGLNVSSNGFITFGATAPAGGTYTPISLNTAYAGAIAPFGRDLEAGYVFTANRTLGSLDLTNVSNVGILQVGDFLTGTGIPLTTTVTAIVGTTVTMSLAATTTGTAGTVRSGGSSSNIQYVTEGVAPNRVFVVQYSNFKRFGTTLGTVQHMNLNFQIRLSETTNAISIVYGNCSPGLSTFTTVNQVGLRGPDTNFATNVNNRRNTKGTNDDWVNSLQGTVNTSGMLFNNVAPANVVATGLTYTWSPPIPCSGTPTGGTVAPTSLTLLPGALPGNLAVTGSSSGVTGLTLQWEESADGIAYVNAVGGTGATTTVYTPPAYTGTPIFYRLRITCANSGIIAYSTVCSIVSCPINTVPATENFVTYVPSCWQEADNGDLIAGPATFGTSDDWNVDGFGNVGATGAMDINIFTTGANDWILSPLYTIPATGYELKFDAAAVQFNATTAPTTPWEADDFIEVLVSTGTTNWTVLHTYNDTNQPSNTGTTNIIDLDAYAGQNVRFAYRGVEGATDGGADIEFSIDNFEIRLSPACPQPTGLASANITTTTADISWNAVAPNYEYVLDQVATDPAGAGTPTAAITYNATGLTPNTTYYFHVRSACGGASFSIWSTISFTTVALPPANDDCITTPIVLTAGGIFTDQDIDGTNIGASLSAETPIPTCGNLNFATAAKDVWYSVVVPASGTITIETGVDSLGSPDVDTVIAAYTGTCGALTQVGCDDDGAATLALSLMSLTGLTGGDTLLIRAFGYDGATGRFSISAYDATLSAQSFDLTGFSAYPNPVKDVLNLSYTKEISNVSVHNLLGQEVMTKTINATQSKIDMSNLSNGTYLVKVTVDGLVKTLKVVKQ